MNKEKAIESLTWIKEKLVISEDYKKAYDMAIEALQAEPKHGKWVEDDPIQHEYFRCSNCGIGQFNWGEDNYCRNCGAKMDKE